MYNNWCNYFHSNFLIPVYFVEFVLCFDAKRVITLDYELMKTTQCLALLESDLLVEILQIEIAYESAKKRDYYIFVLGRNLLKVILGYVVHEELQHRQRLELLVDAVEFIKPHLVSAVRTEA